MEKLKTIIKLKERRDILTKFLESIGTIDMDRSKDTKFIFFGRRVKVKNYLVGFWSKGHQFTDEVMIPVKYVDVLRREAEIDLEEIEKELEELLENV